MTENAMVRASDINVDDIGRIGKMLAMSGYFDSANNIEVSYEREIKQFTNCDNSEWHVIYVKNWGLGVLETEKDSIFDEYKRGSNASSREVTGTGIGLFLSNEIIKRHDGYIEVRKLNKPTIFAIYLPTYLEEKRPNYENTINR